MAENKKHRIDEETYRRYLSGNMTPAERHAFEKAMLDDLFAHEALEGMESMEPEHLAEDLKALKTQLAQRTQKKEQPLFWRIAATLLLLGIFSFVIYYFIDTNAPTELAQEKPALSEKADTTANIKTKTDSVLTKTPDEIIAYQQPLHEEIATRSSTGPELEKIQQDIVSEKSKEQDIALDYSTESEADARQAENETTEEKVAEIPAAAASAPAVIAEMKKAEASPAQKRKAITAEPSNVAGAVAPYSHVIRGKVISADDDSPVPGVNVIVKGTSTATVTDVDGYYELTIPPGDTSMLVFSSVGYNTQEVDLNNYNELDIVLNTDAITLSEVVVVGYATQAKQDLTGAISTISSKDLKTPIDFIPPKPMSGQAKFNDYIKENLRYPASGLASGLKGSVRIQFTITATGSMTNIQVIRSLGEDFDNEALRLIKDGPKWEPAEENGSRVARDVKVTIRFKPPE